MALGEIKDGKAASSSLFSTSSAFSHWDFSSDSEVVRSRGSDVLWRSHSLWSSVASFSLLLVPLSRKLARGGRSLAPLTVREPSMALRSWREKGERGVRCKSRPAEAACGTVVWLMEDLAALHVVGRKCCPIIMSLSQRWNKTSV